ncbi:MAG TPA: aldolase/citrate lyase family protein [Oscillospiraceae bacterium]|nr:aldolase/citrate lyase family protein [Oscillospiraceae bacterium]
MDRFELKKAFLENRRVYGTLIASTSPKWVSQLKNIGADFVFIDSEHMPLDRSVRAWLCECCNALGIAPIVRIPFCCAYEAFAAIEDGAAGIVSPYLETAEEIDMLIGAVKYRPLKGERLKRVLSGEEILTQKEQEYLDSYNDGLLLLLNVESRLAVDNLEELVSKPEVDGVFIGPHDLSINMGIPEEYDSDEFESYIEKIIKTCNKYKKGIGNHFSGNVEKQIQWAKKGMNIVIWSSDISVFVKTITDDFNRVKQELGEDTQVEATDVTI